MQCKSQLSGEIEPAECEVCKLEPQTETTMTTNRGLFGVNHKLWLDPLCPTHDNLDVETTVNEVYDYGGEQFVTQAIRLGVFTLSDAHDYLPSDAYDNIRTRIKTD